MSIRLSEMQKITAYDLDPDATSATSVAFVDMKNFKQFMAMFVRTVGTSAVTFLIQASATSNGASPVTIKTKTFAAQPDAVADLGVMEINVDELANAGTDLRYVSAVITFATGTDEAVIVYELGDPLHCEADLTADITA